MNILFYSNFGFNPKNGGVQRVSNILAEGFLEKGHKVFLVGKSQGETDPSYVPVAEELILNEPDDVVTPRGIEIFTEFVRTRNVDIILCQHSHYWEYFAPHIVKQSTGVKLLYVFHTTPCVLGLEIGDTSRPVFSFQRGFWAEYRRLTRAIFKKQKQEKRNRKMGEHLNELYNISDGLVFLAPQYINSVLNISDIPDSKRLYAIGNPNTYAENDILDLPKEDTLLFVGRLEPEKSPEKALLLWRRLQNRFPGWNIKFVGGGDLKEPLERLRDEWKLERCSIEGRQDPAPYYAKAKILLLTSDFEGFPMALMEAMQHGVVPVAFNSFEALEDIIEDGVTGLAVRPYDLKEFENKLAYLMKNNTILAEMAEAAKLSVRKFNVSSIVDEWLELFDKIGINL